MNSLTVLAPLSAPGLLVLGLFLMVWAYARRRRAEAPQHWREASAHVRAARVVPQGRGFEPEVEYEYEVDGHRFVGHRYAAQAMSPFSRTEADRLVLKFAPDTDPVVRYDPADPGRAVLDSHAHGAGVAAALLGALLMLLGAVLLASLALVTPA